MVDFRGLYVRRNLVYGISIALAVVASIIIVLLSVVENVPLPFPPQTMVILVTLVFFIFPNIMEFSYQRWRRQIDNAVPGLLADVAAAVKTGINLDRALELAADRDYGPLTGELKKLRAQLELGVPFEDAIERLIQRVKTVLVDRSFSLILQANRAGGKIENLLDIIQSDANDLYLLEKERNASIRPYVVIIYIAFGVFLAVSVLLVDSFFTSVLNSHAPAGTSSQFGGTLSGLTLTEVKNLFLQMALIEAIFGGFGAGKLGEGSFSGGFKHVLIMAAMTVVIFVVFV
ncbi:MAG: type II secretion system F family protein [Nitrososphaerota archaeon]|nr:type II secretion system F family protein [Nitrososphaerota archaeon]